MMVSTCLLRVKRRTERLWEVPGVQMVGTGAGYLAGGALLAALRIWGQMQPGAMGLIVASRGWRCLCGALGGAVGYWMFWGRAGLQGMAWCAGALLLAFLLPKSGQSRMAAGSAGVVAGLGLFFPGTDALLLGLRAAVAWCAAMLGSAQSYMPLFGVAAMALAGVHPLAGYAAAGLAAGAVPLPGAVLAGLGADLGAWGGISLAAAACLATFIPWKWAAPGLACAALMLLTRSPEPGLLLAVGLGGAVGAMFPWHVTPAPRQGSVAGAQVRLEQTAQVLLRFQRQLLEYVPPAPDVQSVLEQLRQNLCGGCTLRDGCLERQRLNVSLLTSEAPFPCRRDGQAELTRSREQLRRMKAARAIREDYRGALIQQYGFLSDTLHSLSDRLRDGCHMPRFRVQVSSRSQGRAIADGDKAAAFPGLDCKYYVVLCDGMGTGLGAAEESHQAMELIQQMLTAGLTPQMVMGSVNSQLTLLDRGGAVTVDLAEIRLDTGRVWLYKWGAGPSWLLGKRRGSQVGASGPPPGLGVRYGRENISHVDLSHGATLVLASDGIHGEKLTTFCADGVPPSTLAERILAETRNGEDDATVIVIRLAKRQET